MTMRSNPLSKGIRAVWNMKKSLPLTVNLMRDARVDRLNKLIFLFVTIGYLLFPYDFIFDFPIFGQLDDLAILLYMLNWFISRAPEAVLKEYGWDAEKAEKQKQKKEKKTVQKKAVPAKADGRLKSRLRLKRTGS